MSEAADWVREQLASLLSPGEEILHVGRLMQLPRSRWSAAFDRQVWWAALTSSRLLLITARNEPFVSLQNNQGIDSIACPDIQWVARHQARMIVALTDGRRLNFSADWALEDLPEQWDFLQALLERFPVPPEEQAAIGRRWRRWVVATVAGALVSLIVVIVVVAGGAGSSDGAVMVEVQCHGSTAGLFCRVARIAGDGEGTVCWDMTLGCADGMTVRGERCSKVPVDVETIPVGETWIANLERRDRLVRLEVSDVHVQVQRR
jgi:hypothetical protein